MGGRETRPPKKKNQKEEVLAVFRDLVTESRNEREVREYVPWQPLWSQQSFGAPYIKMSLTMLLIAGPSVHESRFHAMLPLRTVIETFGSDKVRAGAKCFGPPLILLSSRSRPCTSAARPEGRELLRYYALKEGMDFCRVPT